MKTKAPRQTNYPIMSPEELRVARQEMELTQPEAANKYELSLRGYKQYELGERAIPGPVKLLTQYFLRDHRKK
jgi:DNA-binding transcriptional regulator YiaG